MSQEERRTALPDRQIIGNFFGDMGLRRWCEARRFPRGPKAMFVLKVEFKPTAGGEAFTVMSSLDLLNKVKKHGIKCFQYDATHSLIDGGRKVLVGGASDRNRKFHCSWNIFSRRSMGLYCDVGSCKGTFGGMGTRSPDGRWSDLHHKCFLLRPSS